MSPLVSEVQHSGLGTGQVVLRPKMREIKVAVRRVQRARQQIKNTKLPASTSKASKSEQMLRNFGDRPGVAKWTQAVQAGLQKAGKPPSWMYSRKKSVKKRLGLTFVDGVVSLGKTHEGIMVAVRLNELNAEELALKPCAGCRNTGNKECQMCGGFPPESASELHVTLAYIPAPEDGWPDDVLERVVEVVAESTSGQEALTGRVGGVGRFTASDTSDGLDVLIALIDVPGLDVLRVGIVDALTEASLEPSDAHGYVPHTTLRYLPSDAPMKMPRLPDIELLIENVEVVLGDRRRMIMFKSDA